MHSDFRYEGVIPEPGDAPTTTRTIGARVPGNVAQPIMDAAALAYRIRSENPDPKTWAPLIAAAPDEIRDRVRTMLADYYTRERERLKRERLGKKTEVGDAEVEKLQKLVRKL